MTGVFEQYKKGVFGVHKGVVFRTVLKGLGQFSDIVEGSFWSP